MQNPVVERINENEVRLLRFYGSDGEVLIPEEAEGLKLTEIGAYCFSDHKPAGRKEETDRKACKATSASALLPVCGDLLETAVLPNTVTALGAYAFYDCKNLRSLTVGHRLTEIGDGAFMNCRNLKRLRLNAKPKDRTGLRRILKQWRSELQVSFLCDGTEEARILFPEFTESYEEIGPAHIFGLRIEGEGKRIREQFRDEVFDFRGYDASFLKACQEESLLTLLRMAACRLRFPVDLSGEAEERYRDFFRSNEKKVLGEIIDRRMKDELRLLLECGLVSPEARRFAIRRASAAGFLEGNLILITAASAAG